MQYLFIALGLVQGHGMVTFVNLEGIMLVKLDRERQILFDITFMWNLKKKEL